MDNRHDLVIKYSRQAPRYTSYPPALHFQEMTDPDRAIQLVEERNSSPRSLSLYIHIPFCASLCWYCGCTKVITRRKGDSAAYLKRLFSEMEALHQRLNPGNRVAQVHFGGGSPTFLSPDEIRKTGKKIRSLFFYEDEMELAVEIDPRRFTKDHAAALAEIGCNRASIGIQDIHENVQKAINRIQPMKVNEQVAHWLREAGINSINIDLIYGLPLQTPESFKITLDSVKALNPDRFAIFNYAHIPWLMPSQKLLDRHPMPGPHEKFAMLEMMISHLTQSGYNYIGMDHFAKTDDELSLAQQNGTLQRNFQGYSTHGDTDIYGFGMSSISQIGNGYLQSVKNLDEYQLRIDKGLQPWHRQYYLNRDDQIRRFTIMRLMCDLQLDFASLGKKWNIDSSSYFKEAMPPLWEMAKDGLIEWAGTGLRVTDTGRMFLRNIATAFDACYKDPEKQKRYSKTV